MNEFKWLQISHRQFFQHHKIKNNIEYITEQLQAQLLRGAAILPMLL